jgi:hypothetical protein
MNVRLLGYLLFLFGFLFYIFLPLFFLIVFPYYNISEIAMKNYNGNYYLLIYSYLAFGYFILFSMGYYLTSFIKINKFKAVAVDFLGWAKVAVTLIYSCIALFVINLSEILNPIGYLDGYDVTHRGQLTTLYLTSIWWCIYFKSGINSKLMLVIAFIAGINLVALGSRLGIVTGLISMLIFYFYFNNTKVNRTSGGFFWYAKIGFILFLSGMLMTIIGLLREGNILTMEGMFSIFASEPLFIYASVPAYFTNNPINLFEIPVDLFVSIIGAIPSFIFPLKSEFFLTHAVVSSESASGFGGMNHLVTLVANFGMVGFPVVSFIEGVWFGMLTRLVHKNSFFRAVALSSFAILPFILFREGLQTSVKLLFFNFLVFPFIIIQILTILKIILRKATSPQTSIL